MAFHGLAPVIAPDAGMVQGRSELLRTTYSRYLRASRITLNAAEFCRLLG